ncbi:MAG: glyoxalase [Verrucomicrobia bacterium]|nr:MAG: glyoxalase [Verrucomicrobiota bacterium]
MAAKLTTRRRQPPKPQRNRPPVPVRAVDFVMYSSRDMRKTRKFYQELFGLKRGGEWNDSWSEFRTAPITLCLNGPSKTPGSKWQGTPALALAVEDIHSAIAACRARKVRILQEPVETRVCWMALVSDPEGNRICLHQRKDGTAG